MINFLPQIVDETTTNNYEITHSDGTVETVKIIRRPIINQVGTPLSASNLNQLQTDLQNYIDQKVAEINDFYKPFVYSYSFPYYNIPTSQKQTTDIQTITFPDGTKFYFQIQYIADNYNNIPTEERIGFTFTKIGKYFKIMVSFENLAINTLERNSATGAKPYLIKFGNSTSTYENAIDINTYSIMYLAPTTKGENDEEKTYAIPCVMRSFNLFNPINNLNSINIDGWSGGFKGDLPDNNLLTGVRGQFVLEGVLPDLTQSQNNKTLLNQRLEK